MHWYHVCTVSDFYIQRHTVQLFTVSGCTIDMATPPLKGVCCRPAYQTSGRQCVITALTVPLKEELLVDNLHGYSGSQISKILKI